MIKKNNQNSEWFNFFIKKIKRKCPCCGRNVINPLDFKKSHPYQCSFCRGYIRPSMFWASFTYIFMVVLQTILYKNNMYFLGHTVFIIFLIRWFFVTKIDAMIQPLYEYEP